MVFNNNLLLGAAGAADGYTIDQSIRFNDNDSAYLSKTFSSGSTVTQYTVSCWVKRGNLGGYQYLFDAGGNYEILRFYGVTNIDSINFEAINGHSIYTNAVFRDVGAWYHIVAVLDSPNAVDTDRIRIYVNGERQSVTLLNSWPTLNETTLRAGGAYAHGIGARPDSPSGTLFDGYIAEYHCVFGQALDPTEFGETNSDTGQWVPKAYTGSYGTNGFYITGADSADLGADDSGNGNDFTSSGLAAADQMPDTPTNNFCTWNPTEPSSKTNMSLQDGNLVANGFDSAQRGTIFVSSGKWYAELTISAAMSAYFGISEDTANLNGNPSLDNIDGYLYYSFNGQKIDQAGSGSSYGSSWNTAGKTVGVAVDMDNGAIWFSVDGTWQNSATISEIENGTTTNAAFTSISGNFALVYSNGTNGLGTLNTGQSSFSYTQPTGFNAWSTDNLPDPTIALPEKYFNTVLYEGNGGGQRVGGFQPITETYSVPNSVIFNDDDSASLTRTPSSAGDRRTFTFSCWVKRASLTGANQPIFSAGGDDWLMFLSAETLGFNTSGSNYRIVTNQVFKDTSTWFHVVLRVDTTNATAGDRLRLYINGSEITDFGTDTNPTLNFETAFNNTVEHQIGKLVGASQYFDGYLAEINHIDGQSLGPDSFGQLDASTNRWIPKDTSGLTFGTNGFYLDFESGKESTSGATTTNMNATQFVNGSMGSWGTGDTAYDFTGGTTDKNINTGTSFIASSTDFDFYGTLSAAASPNAPFLGWYTSGTNTNAGTPSTTASAGVFARNGNSTGVYSGWLLLSSTREAERPNKSWEFQRKVGVHRRGSQLYGSLNGRIDHKYSSTPSTTSAGGFFLGNSGDGTSYTWSDVHSITYSSTTQNQYGLDSSGNGNNFTEEGTWDFLGGGNLSYDTPTRISLGFWDGEFETGGTETVPSFGNTKINTSTGNDVGTPSRGFVSSGKWYYEIDVISVYNGTGNSTYGAYGVVDYDSYGDTYDLSASGGLAYGGKVVAWQSNGTKLDESSATASVFNTVSAGDVIQIALDMDNGAVWFGKNNTWELSATASEIENGDTSNAVRTGLTGEWSPVFHRWTTTERVEINAGSAFRFSDSELSLDTASGGYFKYTPPSGFKSLNNDNLPLSNGDLSAFVWIKNRDAIDNHMLFDAVRGVTKDLHSNVNAAEVTNANTLTRFLKNGFEVSNDAEVNTAGESYVAWQWLSDSLTTSSNTDGSITSTVLANTTSGFSIGTYTGNGTNNATVGHGLGIAPEIVFVKRRNTTGNWRVYSEAVNKNLYLDLTDAGLSPTQIKSTSSTVFTLGSGNGYNGSGDTHVFYAFAGVDGFSKFGSYTGNGSTDGPFVYTGMTPEFVLVKRSNTTENWIILDNARSEYNVTDDVLYPNLTQAENANSTTTRVDNISNGFKVRGTNTNINASGSTYIYMAFAESPFKTATAR